MKKADLLKRKKRVTRLVEEGFKFDEFPDYLPEKDQDPKLAAFYKISDVILDLRDARLIKKITQEQLAQKMGTKQESISRFENYETHPSIDFILKYARALGEDMVVRLKTDLIIELPASYKEKLKKLKRVKGEGLNQHLTQLLMNLIDFNSEDEVYVLEDTYPSVKAVADSGNFQTDYSISKDVNTCR